MNRTNSSAKIGIFGGSFDPIHLGHISPVITALEAAKIERLIYLPCYQQPLKQQSGVSGIHRLSMCKIAIDSIETSIKLELCDVEIQAEQTSYTYNTLGKLKLDYPHDELHFIIGMDSLLTFDKWYKWREILNICNILVMVRPEYERPTSVDLPADVYEQLGKTIHFVENKSVKVSSSDIRSVIQSKMTGIDKRKLLVQWLPDEVISYIEQHNLYKHER